MAGIITALSTVNTIFGAITNTKTDDKKSLAEAIKTALTSKDAKLIRTDGSITKLLSDFIVEPVIIATNNTRNVEVIDKILDVNSDIFASFYTQAFEVLTTIYKTNVVTTIDVLGTDNGGVGRAMLKAETVLSNSLSSEDIDKDYLHELFGSSLSVLSIESDSVKINTQKRDTKDQPTAVLLQRNLEISVSRSGEGDKTHTILIPITVKMHVLFVSTENLLLMLAPNSAEKSFGYRLDEYRSGAISLSDLIFANDLIKQYKDNKLKDDQSLLSLLNSRTISANSKLADKSIVGFEKSYNMLVITAEDKILLDKHINGDLTNEKYKQILLEQANAMTVTVIDQDYERVYILTRDIRGKTDISFKAISRRKDSGIDLSEVMKAMMSGRPPIF